VKSAFGIFFFQRQSMLDYQRQMKEQPGNRVWVHSAAVR
jgi:hypothetical protein